MAKGPRKRGVQFGTASLTHYGGVYLLHRFFTRIGFKHAIAQEVRFGQRNHRYTVGEMLLALLYPMVLGLERIETTQLLQQNGVFQFLTGLRSYPDPSTLRRFLLRVAPRALPQLRRLHDRLLGRMWPGPGGRPRLIFDLDSTVLVVYGRQEKAKAGASLLFPVVVLRSADARLLAWRITSRRCGRVPRRFGMRTGLFPQAAAEAASCDFAR